MGSRRIVLTVAGAFGLVVVLAAAAWACTSSATISLSVNNGKPGVAVGVSGSEFPHNGQVRVFWEPNAGDRQLLFETSESSFAHPINIPDNAPAGTHYVKAYGYGEEGELRGTAAASFTVPHGTVAGQINDADTGEGVHGAEVSVADGGGVVGTAQTEADGTYQIGDIDQGSYTVTVRRPGYQEASTQVDVRLGESSDISLAVTRQPQEDPNDSAPEPSDEQRPDGSQTSEPEGSESAAPEGAESERPEDSSARGTTLEGSSSGNPVPQESDSQAPSEGASESAAPREAAEEPATHPKASEPTEPAHPAPSADQQAEPAPAAPQPADQPADTAADEQGPVEQTASEHAVDDDGAAGQALPAPEAADAEDDDTAVSAGRPDTNALASSQAPTARSGAADLWSGLATDAGAALAGTDQLTAPEPDALDQPLVLALGLLGGGMFLLAGGGLVAARRRRVPADATTAPRSG